MLKLSDKIKIIDDQGTFEDVVAESSDEIKDVAYALRNLLVEVMPDITEVAWSRQKIVGYGVGPKKMSEHFCYIAPYKGHVNFGFMYGADLSDPDGLLEGSGALLRHIKICSVDETKNPAIKMLVEAASVYLPKLKT